jgi:hypothetical protein
VEATLERGAAMLLSIRGQRMTIEPGARERISISA